MYKDLKRKPGKLKAIDSATSVYFANEIKTFRRAEAGKKWARDAKGMEVLAAYLGKTQGMLNRSGIWEQIQLADGEIWATVPLFAAMMRSIAKEASRSKPLYGFRGDFAEADEQEVARYGTAIIEYLSKRFWRSEEDQEDVLSSMAFGFGVFMVEWDEADGEEQELVELACGECGMSGYVHKEDVQEEKHCENEDCMGMMAVREELTVPAGDVKLSRIDPFSFNSNTWANADRPAIWWSIDEIVDRSVWEDEHPEIELPMNAIGTALGEDLLHLRRQRTVQRAQMGLESSVAVSRGRVEITGERDVVFRRDFFAPTVYKRRVTGMPETLPSGREIPGNTPLAELYEDGVCVLQDAGGRVLDIYPANPSRSIKIYNFAVKPNDRWGASIAAQALECQYALEEDLSQLQTVASEMGNPTMFYDESLFDGRLGSHPAGKQPVHRRLTEMGLSDLIMYAPAGVPSPIIFQLVLFYEQRMQGVIGSSSGSGGGLPDSVGPTATANMNARIESEGQQGQYLELRAQAKMDVIEEGVRLFARHADIRRAVSMGGPFADGAVLKVNKDMLPSKFKLELKPDSWWPRDRGQKQQAEMTRHSMLGAANQSSMMMTGGPIDVLEERWIADTCGSEIGNNVAQIGAEIAVKEWKKAKAFIGRAMGGVPTEDDVQHLERAKRELIAEAASQLQDAAMMQQINELGTARPPMGPVPGGVPDGMPVGSMPDPMQAGATEGAGLPGPVGPPVPAGVGPAGMPMGIPPPPLDKIVLAAVELAVPIRPGLVPAARAIAGQLRLEALKVPNRELPDIYLEFLDRRAQAYKQLGRDEKMAETTAAGGPEAMAPPPPPPPGGPAMGTGNPIMDGLSTKMAAIQGGTTDSLGLPRAPSIPQPPAAGERPYG